MSQCKPPQPAKKTEVSIVRSSAAKYLTFVAATGNGNASVEMRYDDENLWLTQKMMATRDGKTVQIDIYENGEGGWLLEVIDDYTRQSPPLCHARRPASDRCRAHHRGPGIAVSGAVNP